MNIPSILGFSFNPKTNINRNLTNKFNLFSNLKLNRLNADTVSFTSNKNKSEDEEYYREIAKKVNQSLKEGDDLTAFETLGYDIDLDWVSEKITIKGNYVPFFICNSKNGITVKPYAEFGIDENKLLQDVEAVEGMRVYYPLESEENDRIKINSNSRSCKENEFDILKALLQARAPRVEEALNEDDSETALNLLGFETSSNKAGEITIEGDYSDTLLTKDFARESVSLRDIGIDENKLLKNVTKIKGNASFSAESDFEPKQYIKIDGTCDNHEIARKLVLQNRDFIDKVSSIKDSISAGDNYAALKKLGLNPKKADDGSITIDCSYAPILRDNRFVHMKQGPLKFSFKTLGIDDKNLFENVSAINSNVDLGGSNIDHLEDIAIKTNLKLTGSKVKVLGKNVFVGGLVYHGGIDAEQLFANYVNYDRQISTNERVKDKIFHGLVTNGIVTEYLKSHEGKYYFYPDSADSEFMDTLSQNRDTVLTGDEICKETGLSTTEFMNLINKYRINPYCMNRLPYYIHLDELLFDINDRRSGKSLNDAIDIRNSTIIDADGHSTGALEKDVNRKLRKIEHFGKYSAYSMDVPAKVLEQYGYGRKQDILAACSIMRYQHDICNYVLNNDDYNVHSHIMMDILDTARNSNPEILKINDLSKLLSERDYKKLLAAIINGEVDAIPYDVLRWTQKGNYFINLFSEKNYEFFKNINDLEFQALLDERKKAAEEYRARNDKIANRITEAQQLSNEEWYATKLEILKEIEEPEQVENNSEIKDRRKEFKSKYMSLRSTIAWYLSPETRQVMRRLMNPRVRNIFDKYNKAKELKKIFMSGEISEAEFQEKIKEMNLPKKEEIILLGYFKSAWEAIGTEEFSKATKEAIKIADTYFEFGIDAIQDENVKHKIKEWEEKHDI